MSHPKTIHDIEQEQQAAAAAEYTENVTNGATPDSSTGEPNATQAAAAAGSAEGSESTVASTADAVQDSANGGASESNIQPSETSEAVAQDEAGVNTASTEAA